MNMTSEKILTPEGLEKLNKELDERKKMRPFLSDKIAQARELGDLSENAEYHQAREEQAYNEGRILEIELLLKEATIVTRSHESIVGIGSQIHITNGIKESTYTIVGATEANPSAGLISCESPLGFSFLGKKKGDEVMVQIPSGNIKYKILNIE